MNAEQSTEKAQVVRRIVRSAIQTFTYPDKHGKPVRRDPTYGRIDRELQWFVQETYQPTTVAQRVVLLDLHPSVPQAVAVVIGVDDLALAVVRVEAAGSVVAVDAVGVPVVAGDPMLSLIFSPAGSENRG